MFDIVMSNQFKRDLKRAHKRGLDIAKLNDVVNKLANNESLEMKYRDHELKGNFFGFRECHLEPDWLLVYKIEQEEVMLFLFRTGTHADLFE